MSKRKKSQKARRKGARTGGKRGRRYTPEEKRKALELTARVGVQEAAKRTGITPWSIYAWRNALTLAPLVEKPAPPEAGKKPGPLPRAVQVPEAVVKQVVTVWRNNPGFGPSQVHYQLRRVGVKCDTKTIRKILTAHGYSPPGKRPPRSEEPRRFEASRPLELVQMDVLHFYIHGQRVYLILALDDHSRFVVGWGLLQRETMEDAIAVVEEAIRRYGKPEAILTDRGAAFHAWSGVSRFDRMLESYGIDHRLASAHHPQTCGKIEALNKAIQKELISRVEFRNFLDAKEQIRAWIDSFNHERTHQGLGGVLVPADRFHGRADRVLERIQTHQVGKGNGPVPAALEVSEENREISLFQVRLVGDNLELWLFGRRVGQVSSRQAAA
ncbi:MAG: DDE-type integrase/transposase/recombinase [Thermoleophilia bacterium]|nr:DDE-type integrase/transposase/recombinase [Thermoleophilia bacterium]